jgi:DNA-binding response OmpR family regulator
LPRARPDLVLMDVMVPDLDGPGTMKRMHAMAGFEDLPVVFMTAHVQKDKQVELIRQGAITCISKPFDATSLADTITAIWRGVQASRAEAVA